MTESELGVQYEIGLTRAEVEYYQAMKDFPEGEYAPGELTCVGAGIGGGFANTKELHVMKYDEAMAGNEKERVGESRERRTRKKSSNTRSLKT